MAFSEWAAVRGPHNSRISRLPRVVKRASESPDFPTLLERRQRSGARSECCCSRCREPRRKTPAKCLASQGLNRDRRLLTAWLRDLVAVPTLQSCSRLGHATAPNRSTTRNQSSWSRCRVPPLQASALLGLDPPTPG